MTDIQQNVGAFDDADVARCYAYRPPYAPALYDFLRDLVPSRRCLVDLGCGPGKIAAALAGDFAEVVAIDAAPAMIDAARATHTQANIRWLNAPAEDAALPEAIDLVTAGTSIHWMKHEVLFPRLAARTPLVAVITGDAPPAPPWLAEQRAFLSKWLARVHGQTYDEKGFSAEGRSYEAWLDIAGRRSFAFTYRLSIADHIACEHSRSSWSRTRLGAELAREFDAELQAQLTPYATDGLLTLDLTSELVWGAPRAMKR
ncbi:MAG: class I SAM-dependent methyltransferase [Rhizomicrobium sp.]